MLSCVSEVIVVVVVVRNNVSSRVFRKEVLSATLLPFCLCWGYRTYDAYVQVIDKCAVFGGARVCALLLFEAEANPQLLATLLTSIGLQVESNYVPIPTLHHRLHAVLRLEPTCQTEVYGASEATNDHT